MAIVQFPNLNKLDALVMGCQLFLLHNDILQKRLKLKNKYFELIISLIKVKFMELLGYLLLQQADFDITMLCMLV